MRTTNQFVKCLFAIPSGNWSISNQTSICVCNKNKFARDKSNHFEWQALHQLLSKLTTVCRRNLVSHVRVCVCVRARLQNVNENLSWRYGNHFEHLRGILHVNFWKIQRKWRQDNVETIKYDHNHVHGYVDIFLLAWLWYKCARFQWVLW